MTFDNKALLTNERETTGRFYDVPSRFFDFFDFKNEILVTEYRIGM